VRRIQLVLATLAIVVTALAAFPGPVMAQTYYYDDCWAYDVDYGWFYWCDDYYEDDGYYYISPDAYYYYPDGPNGPWSFRYTGNEPETFSFEG
jgi:hypothetical protein